MPTSKVTSLYRAIVREVYQASPIPRAERNSAIYQRYRTIFERGYVSKDLSVFEQDMTNLVTLMRSQRMYRTLLERYNPLQDLTAQEKIKATARRVGLDMPEGPKGE